MSDADATSDDERLTGAQAAHVMLEGAREAAVQEITRAITSAARAARASNGEVVCAVAYTMANIMVHDPDPDATLAALTAMATSARQRILGSSTHAAGHA